MKYRALDANGDYTVGQPFLSNTPQTVAQAVITRLRLWKGEWFLDVTDGTPWQQNVLGKQTGNPDAAIKARILGTPGVTSIMSYSSTYSGGVSYTAKSRQLTISCTLATLYGAASIAVTL